MIYTCTTNPSLDYYITFTSSLTLDQNNRSDLEMFEAGGKGVNVSIMLNNFHIPSVCLGFIGGFTKEYYLSFISNYPNIQPLFTTIKENTRINVKIMDDKYETSLNAKGPYISKEEFEKFKKRTLNIYNDDIFVLSGSVQDEIEEDIIALVHELAQDGVKIVLDTDAHIINKCLDINCFMIKLNDGYFTNNEDVIETCKSFVEKGVINVMYSNAHKPSYLFTKDKNYKCETIEDSLVNSTGSSDSMVAGFLYSSLRGASSYESFKYANAASLATTLSNDLESKKIIEDRFNKIEVIEF
ncbi:MAG: 1-phosphofructokinase family hexose kinase [Erysipelotrichaceae bacterium]|nr:1-phosphofructokinase family hexose kinase [Erysipelotrichaceae bacterium]